jgi:hypothetical protein
MALLLKASEKQLEELEDNVIEKVDEPNLEEAQPDVEEAEQEEEKEELPDETELLREKLYQEKRRRKGLYATNSTLEKENEALRQALVGTVDMNKELYADNLYSDLKKVKEIKRQALMGDDPDLVVEVDELQQKLLLKIHDFENRQANSSYDEDDSEEEHNPGLEAAQEWLNENPEIIEGTDEYDPKIQKDVHKFVEKLDRELKKVGKSNVVFSDGYFQLLDRYISNIKRNVDGDGYAKSSVGGVRNNFSSPNTGTIKIELTQDDKRIISQLNISEKDYLRAKIERIKNEKSKRA